MSDLISRKGLMKKIAHHKVYDSMTQVTFERAAVYEFVKADMFGLVKSAPAVDVSPHWISVDADKKPKNGKDYLCICTLPNDPKHEWDWVSVLRWHSNGDNGYVNGPHFQHEGSEGMKVTHWMPIPPMPKGDAK